MIASGTIFSSVQRVLYAMLLLLTTAVHGSKGPQIHDKGEAPTEVRAIFDLQDDTESRRGTAGVQLARRSIQAEPGIDGALAGTAGSALEPVLVVAAFDRFPPAGAWQRWSETGARAVAYFGDRHWLLAVSGSVDDVFVATRAVSFVAFGAQDKVDPKLDAARLHDDTTYFDRVRGTVVVDVTLRESDPAAAAALRDRFHTGGDAFVDNAAERMVTLVLEAHRLGDLAADSAVIAVVPGLWRHEELMDGVRAVVAADTVVGQSGVVLTGQGVRLATNERMGDNFAHEDFFEHDAFGQPTVPRWTEAVAASCLDTGGNGTHGQMTAGIMLGNGWQSAANGGYPLAFRGIAPEGTFDCYDEAGGRAHVSSHSYVSTPSTTNTHWDAAVLGELGDERHHAHVAAGGNSGISLGYFSMRNNAKNAMIVANAQVNGHIHPSNSSGPTHDGRIKPDIAAPTRNWRPELADGFAIEIEQIELRRGPFLVYRWQFDEASFSWHQGWGQTVNPGQFGEQHLEATQTATGNMLLAMDPQPWGSAWGLSPVVGTQIVPYSHPSGGGAPLALAGHPSDVLEIRYRAVLSGYSGNLGYFDMKPVWFRAFPPASSSDWHSQGNHGAVGIGDGLWRTLQVPVGQAEDVFLQGNPFWPGIETWAGHDIRYLGLRFGGTDYQPTTAFPQYVQRSGGTSGASPVVGGAYGLAMEHLTRLYRKIDLDDKVRSSIYRVGAAPPYGMPMSSTWKALFVHTARDMTDTMIGFPISPLPPNPDTGVPTSYHAGPDFTTGYGMLDVQSGIDLMTEVAEDEPLYAVTESSLASGQYHVYTFDIPDSFVAGDFGFKVTLAWDDPPAYGVTAHTAPKLVNNLGLVLRAPDGTTYFPWSIDLPYEYDESNGPHILEPEPITDADIVPARRDQPNDLDNVEQVQVDDLGDDQSGTWQVYVADNGMGAPSLSLQGYSLVVSPWRVSGQCHDCD